MSAPTGIIVFNACLGRCWLESASTTHLSRVMIGLCLYLITTLLGLIYTTLGLIISQSQAVMLRGRARVSLHKSWINYCLISSLNHIVPHMFNWINTYTPTPILSLSQSLIRITGLLPFRSWSSYHNYTVIRESIFFFFNEGNYSQLPYIRHMMIMYISHRQYTNFSIVLASSEIGHYAKFDANLSPK